MKVHSLFTVARKAGAGYYWRWVFLFYSADSTFETRALRARAYVASPSGEVEYLAAWDGAPRPRDLVRSEDDQPPRAQWRPEGQ